jgi:thiol-disulfide isomerase/thioredoxin
MMDGSEVGLINLQGKKVVLLFWAAWCSASRPVHEDLNDLARKYGGRRDVEFIAVSIDKAEDLQKLQDRIRAGKFFDVKQAFSGNEHLDEAYRAFRVDTLPTVFFIDENGTVVEYGHSAGFVEDLLRR